jgi:hypothetical protein
MHAISWRVVVIWIAVASIPVVGQMIGIGVWRAMVFRPWMEATRLAAEAAQNAAAAGGTPVFIAPRPPSAAPMIAVPIVSIALTYAAFIAITPACNRGIARRYTRGMLDRARCPWCSYDLSGAAPSDAPITCPECGGCWRLGPGREDPRSGDPRADSGADREAG